MRDRKPRRRGSEQGDAEAADADVGSFFPCRDLTVMLISEDEREVSAVRHMLTPGRLVHALVWSRTVDEAVCLLGPREGLVCVLVGRSLSEHTPTEVVRRIRQYVPHAALVVINDPESSARATLLGGAVEGYVNGEGDGPGELSHVVWLALQRRYAETVRTTLEASALAARENASFERGLLPAPVLLGDDFTAASRYEPGRSHALLSGDFYDVVQTEDSTVHVVLGDVSGHGAAEAALAVHLRVAWRTAVHCGKTPIEQLGILEKVLVDERADDDTYATVVSLVFSPERTSVRSVSAGHHGLLLRGPFGDVRWVEPQAGIALGLFPGTMDWAETEMEISPRDSVVLFTDGLIEGKTDACARLGEEGLLQLATRYAHLPSQQFIDALVASAASMASPFGGLADDVAVLHLGWNPSKIPRACGT
ncbi:PP2C family protein-serine/threonine phosphatase [Streptomyces sp. NPDC052016]|uniref:PP2C family protein-serine/threonine phosphatase n=1 Tax=Streptomyces sp. NPDC052016 TaxID=3365680 RepID=UPI0037D3B414